MVLRPLVRGEPGRAPLLDRTLALAAAGALGLAVAQGISLLVEVAALADDGVWPPVGRILATTFARASLVRIVASLGFVVGCRRLRQGGGAAALAALGGSALALVLGSAWTSHAAARLRDREVLLALDALHQVAASVWVGGLIHLFAAVRGEGAPWPGAALKRFSALALGAVAVLVAVGLGLSVYYIDGARALYGTSYGAMLVAKGLLLAGLLALGGANFLAVRRLPADSAPPPRLRRFVETEVGLGITVLFVAASLTSLPPAVDIVADRATLGELAGRFAPQWPRFTSPALAELPIDDPLAPRTAEDRAWSEYNHHVAGLFVLAMGLLAVLERAGGVRWARHWPLLFLGLAAFLFARDDPDAWPLGPIGFWEGMTVRTVVQHRVFVLLTLGFGVFEWLVRTGRLRSGRWALVFPLLAAVGGGLLLTHAHTLDNLKEVFLVEVTHIPLGLLGIFVGWTRWLELRLSPPDNRAPGRLWALGLVAIGLLLLLYRES